MSIGPDTGSRPEPAEHAAAAKIVAWAVLLAFIFLSSAGEAFYSSQGEERSGRFEIVAGFGFVWLLWYWLRAQCGPYRAVFPLDLGFFLVGLWFVILPHYLWRHERWRGLGKYLLILTALALAHAFAIGLHYLLVWLQ